MSSPSTTGDEHNSADTAAARMEASLPPTNSSAAALSSPALTSSATAAAIEASPPLTTSSAAGLSFPALNSSASAATIEASLLPMTAALSSLTIGDEYTFAAATDSARLDSLTSSATFNEYNSYISGLHERGRVSLLKLWEDSKNIEYKNVKANQKVAAQDLLLQLVRYLLGGKAMKGEHSREVVQSQAGFDPPFSKAIDDAINLFKAIKAIIKKDETIVELKDELQEVKDELQVVKNDLKKVACRLTSLENLCMSSTTSFAEYITTSLQHGTQNNS